jgi:hypothetical protein
VVVARRIRPGHQGRVVTQSGRVVHRATRTLRSPPVRPLVLGPYGGGNSSLGAADGRFVERMIFI